MTEFYKHWQGGSSKTKSLQSAMKAVRASYPNPFFWAPFILVGKV
jgi:CHAT domain-containing protein